jgi:hypothetical protein
MATSSNRSAWILVVILAVFLQVVFVFADCRQTATGTAIDFSKAFFLLDADMERYLCSELTEDEETSVVAAHIQAAIDNAATRGFPKSMAREMIYRVETETLAQEDESATIRLEGSRRTRINPVFAFVAKLFHLGETREFEETLELVKQDGKWKVCGAPFGMTL